LRDHRRTQGGVVHEISVEWLDRDDGVFRIREEGVDLDNGREDGGNGARF
jgi:hypothetical protein